jgi:hypothetical protein
LWIDLVLHTEFRNSFQPGEVSQRTRNILHVNSEKVPINCNVSDFDIEQCAIDLDLDSDMYFSDPSNFVAGNVHRSTILWQKIIDRENEEALDWI